MLSRRGLFGVLAGGVAFALDPERALYVPGKKLISIPAPSRSFTAEQLLAVNPLYLKDEEFHDRYLLPFFLSQEKAFAAELDRLYRSVLPPPSRR